jgi:hypothetical protein
VSRQTLATLAALALAVAALWWARGRDLPQTDGGAPGAGGSYAAGAGSEGSRAGAPSAGEDGGSEPQSVVWRMVDASRARDVGAYLACFAGDLRTRLDATAQELGEDGFADYLARRVEELKGVALYDVERQGGTRASVTVEYVFAEEKVLQRLHLEEVRGRWVIAGADESRREKSLIPYGTPIEQVE